MEMGIGEGEGRGEGSDHNPILDCGAMMRGLCVVREHEACFVKYIIADSVMVVVVLVLVVMVGGGWWWWCVGRTPSSSTWRCNGGSMVYVVCVRSKRVL